MKYKVLYKKTFLKELKKLPKKTREKIEVFCFDVVSESGNPSEIKGIEKLTGYDTFYKVRFGDYRVGLEIDRKKRSLVFCRVLHRKEIYRYYP